MADTEASPNNPENQKTEALENNTNAAESGSTGQPDASLELEAEDTGPAASATPSPEPKQKKKPFRQLRQRLNIYLLLLGSVLLIAVAIILIAYLQSRKPSTTSSLKTQDLSQATLQQLANSDASVGSSQYVLNVKSSAIFAGQVIVKQNLQVAGNLQVGGTAAFNNISAAGTGQFSQATINNNLTVGGNSSVQGSATIAKSLQVSGGGTFGGALSAPQITTANLQLSGDLVLAHHITTSGPVPSRAGGPALGGGGSASVSGTDTAGSVSINTGSSPPAGCFVTISFGTHYDTTPHILVTPIGSSAGGLAYYVSRSTTNFSICDATAPPAGSSFGFDYFVIN